LTATVCLHKLAGVNQDSDRLLERLDKLLEAGRVTEAEATRIRGATDSQERDEAIHDIRLRHATERLDEAVEAGTLTRNEAEAARERLNRGEDPRELRGLLRRRRSGPGAPREGDAHD